MQLRKERGSEHASGHVDCRCVRRKKDVVRSERFVQNPMWNERARRVKLQPLEHERKQKELQTAVCDVSASPSSALSSPKLTDAIDPMLQPVIGDYVPAAWYTKLVDVLLLFVLALLSTIVPRPTTVALIATKAVVYCTLLLAVCAHVLLVRP